MKDQGWFPQPCVAEMPSHISITSHQSVGSKTNCSATSYSTFVAGCNSQTAKMYLNIALMQSFSLFPKQYFKNINYNTQAFLTLSLRYYILMFIAYCLPVTYVFILHYT